ncbi:MAG: PQQ-binding-like beta-propeller repeat protein, partial [Acidobacteriia bacterium]|nr:PQQ-binding-like beta-propeller repeat protein [Terriglobia bacterium]
MKRVIYVIAALSTISAIAQQASYRRITEAAGEPQNWLTYSGSYNGQRYSALSQITPENVKNLELQWVYQAKSLEKYEATPLVVDGIMYTIQNPDDVVALDAATGRVYWTYSWPPASTARPCCGRLSRGLAILDNTLFLATIDARLIAIDAKSGKELWNVIVGRPEAGYAMTLAPLVVKNKVIVGVAGGEYGIRGFIDAYDAKTGDRAWRFYTIPGPGEKGHETWSGDSWKIGGAPVWVTGTYDPLLNLTYWGIGNAGPDRNGDDRQGDNLYSSSVVALDGDTGTLKWYYQFSPHNEYDYDATEIPVLLDTEWQGR